MILYPDYILPISSPPLKDYSIALDGNSIVRIGRLPELKSFYPSKTVFRLKKYALLPGFINTHTHMELSFLKGVIPKNLPFASWIRKLIPLKRNCLPEDVKSGMIHAEDLFIRSGITTVLDIVTELGISAEITTSKINRFQFIEALGFKDSDAEFLMRKLLDSYRKISHKNKNKIGLSPHAPFTTSLSLYEKSRQFSIENNLLQTTHLAESQEEINFFQNRKSDIIDLLIEYNQYDGWSSPCMSPIKYLENFIDSSMILAHVNYIQPGDMDILVKAKPVIAVCPNSNDFFDRKNKDKNENENENIKNFLDNGILVTIGTDSLASNNNLNMFDEMRTLRRLNSSITSEEILKMATLNGAKGLRLEKTSGSLEVGKFADIIGVKIGNSSEIHDEIINSEGVGLTIINGMVIFGSLVGMGVNHARWLPL